MQRKKSKAFYERMLKKYPDVMTVPQMSRACDFSSKTGYKLVKEGKVDSLKIGHNIFVPKEYLLSYLLIRDENNARPIWYWHRGT